MSDAPASSGGWDCHVHVFDGAAPVRPGHYVPAHHPLDEIERRAHAHGIDRLVLVQPSVYGTDPTVLLRALHAGGGRHRGVAVVDPAIDDAALDRLHAAGVRGVRFNLVSPVTGVGDPAAALARLAPRLRARGWHVQWYVHAAMLARLADWQREAGLPFVLDHLAGLGAGLADDDAAWRAARTLAEGGAWIKLSGWYRLGADAPYAALVPVIRRAAALFGPHTVWGSDWPHTSFAPGAMPDYDSMLSPLQAALDPGAVAALLRARPSRLYLEGSR